MNDVANARNRIILLGQNLFFQARVETVAEPLGYSVRQAHTQADFWGCYVDGETELVLVDLEGDADTWSGVLTALGEQVPPLAQVPGSWPSGPTRTRPPWNGRRPWAPSKP